MTVGKVKILHLITGLGTGGAESMVYKLLSATDRDRYEPVVLSMIDRGTFGDRIEALGIPIHTLNMRPGRPMPLDFWRLVRTVKRIGPDLIQGWMYHGNLAALLAGSRLKNRPPVIWNIRHSPYQLQYVKKSTAAVIKIGAALSKRPERIIYNARVSADQHEALGYAADKREVIPNGFDLDLFRPDGAARSTVRQVLGLPEEALLIGLIGRFHPMKDHANMLQATAILCANGHDAHVLLIGRGVDHDNEILTRRIAELGLGERIHLLGERRDTPTLTAALDLLVSSSYAEGFSNVIGEAMACAVPCVVTDAGDSAWIVGDTGLVVPPRDPDALADAISTMIELGPSGRQAWGEKARQRVRELFSLPAIVKRYEALYERVLEKGRQKRCVV
jgi:glycosyltransferase involved in cell wall biosynthesis